MSGGPATALPRRLPSLTGARAVAAMGVFVHHVAQVRWYAPTGPLQTSGPAGVSFFFVLSGFVLCWSSEARPEGQPPEPFGRFWVRRVLRLWPLHLLLLAVFAVLEVQHLDLPAPDAALLARHALLVQTWSLDWRGIIRFNWPAWSLAAEASFSFAFPFLVRWLPRGRRALLVVLGACFAMGMVVLPLCSLLVPTADLKRVLFLYELPPVRLFDFVIGVVLARLVARHRVPVLPFLPVTAACVAWVLAVAPALPDLAASTFALLPASALLVVTLAQRDLAGVRTSLGSRPLVAFGAASYAFFLVHHLPLRIRPVVAALQEAALPHLVGLAFVLCALAWAAAFPLHRFVEEPLARLGSRGGTRRRAPDPGGSVVTS